jgi:hypothetical protein
MANVLEYVAEWGVSADGLLSQAGGGEKQDSVVTSKGCGCGGKVECGKVESGKKLKGVLRFCADGADCKREGCHFQHGDRIRKYNRPCALGAHCGETDPSGQKRTLCLYLHPGEVWSTDLYVYRPETGVKKTTSIWDQSFSANLTEWTDEVYNMESLSESDWMAMMTWIYENGWQVDSEMRNSVRAYPAGLPPRTWVPLSDEAPRQNKRSAAPVKKERGVILRFCKHGESCADKGGKCHFVHGDTIPKLNEPCSFGASCGASDPTGLKRSQCLRLHPGETWSPELCICRPKTV